MRRLVSNWACGPLFWLLAAATLEAFELDADIVGTARDRSQAVLVGANVEVLTPQRAVVATTTTDQQGKFRVPGLPEGQYPDRRAVSRARRACRHGHRDGHGTGVGRCRPGRGAARRRCHRHGQSGLAWRSRDDEPAHQRHHGRTGLGAREDGRGAGDRRRDRGQPAAHESRHGGRVRARFDRATRSTSSSTAFASRTARNAEA